MLTHKQDQIDLYWDNGKSISKLPRENSLTAWQSEVKFSTWLWARRSFEVGS